MSPAPLRPLRSTNEGEDSHLASIRHDFLRALDEVTPDVAASLARDVGPSHAALADYLAEEEQRPIGSRAYHALTDLDRLRAASPNGGPLDRRHELQHNFYASLTAWAGSFHFVDEWILREAVRNLDWLASGAGQSGWVVGPVATTQSPPLTPRPPQYRPDRETRADFAARVDEYMEEVEAAYEATQWRRRPYKPNRYAHLRWLARHQCHNLPYEQCGNADPSTIRRAIMDTARELPLTLRPAPGRPRR